jgi:hypothetical protein
LTIIGVFIAAACAIRGQEKKPVDPGVRGGTAGAGGPLKGLTSDETAFFQDGSSRFAEIEAVTGGQNNGLGPRFNSNECLSCHSQPAGGGSSPARNPLIQIATLNGAKNSLPWFITQNGPVREARFKRGSDQTADGEVHAIFVITGRSDAAGCNISQPNFMPAGNPITGQGGNPNIIFRIPTPVFGAGLIEAIPDSTIITNMHAENTMKSSLGISGHPNAHLSGNVNVSANDGTITRFGWKAQNKSLLMFAAEAYNVEMGITNQLFPQERDESDGCLFNATPEDTLNFTTTSAGGSNPAVIPDIEAFANFIANAGPTHPRAGHTINGEWTRNLHQRRLRPLSYTFDDHRQNDCQWLFNQAERRPVQSGGEPVLRSPGPPYGAGSGGRYHTGQCRSGRVSNGSALGCGTAGFFPS